jgi:hypothetical protein
MRRKLGILFAVVFLSVRLLSTLHMAEYGFAEHGHDGKVCDIYLLCKHNQVATAPAHHLVVEIAFVLLALPLAAAVLRAPERYRSGHPRAPPAFLLD